MQKVYRLSADTSDYTKVGKHMKYMNKEWYNTMSNGPLPPQTITKEAEIFSETYYKEIYKIEEAKWIELQESVSKVINKRSFFEEKAAKREFRKIHQTNIKTVKESLTDNILSKIADIRVFALGYASKEVEEEFIKRGNYVKNTMEDYDRQFKKTFDDNPPKFTEKFVLHDSDVISCRKKGKDIEIKIEGVYTDITGFKLKNCTVLKQDGRLYGAQFLYEEIYKSGDRLELHFLLRKWSSKTQKLLDFIVTVDDVELIKD